MDNFIRKCKYKKYTLIKLLIHVHMHILPYFNFIVNNTYFTTFKILSEGFWCSKSSHFIVPCSTPYENNSKVMLAKDFCYPIDSTCWILFYVFWVSQMSFNLL